MGDNLYGTSWDYKDKGGLPGGLAWRYMHSLDNSQGADSGLTNDLINLKTTPSSDSWFSGINNWVKDNQFGLNFAKDIGSFGLGLASFLNQNKMYGKQMNLLDQQIANNKDQINTKHNIESAFSQYGANRVG